MLELMNLVILERIFLDIPYTFVLSKREYKPKPERTDEEDETEAREKFLKELEDEKEELKEHFNKQLEYIQGRIQGIKNKKGEN